MHPSRFRRPPGPLSARIIVLAETPDDASIVADILSAIGPLAADLVEPVVYASVTSERDGSPMTTVSTSSALALAVDNAQYASEAGPCLEAVRTGQCVSLVDIKSTMEWPGFRDTATSLGLRSSLSVPLFVASGRAVASLNLYSPVERAFVALAGRVQQATSQADLGAVDTLDAGSEQLIAGLAEATFIVRVIRRAIGVLVERDQVPPDEAYIQLRITAAEAGLPLTETALALARGE